MGSFHWPHQRPLTAPFTNWKTHTSTLVPYGNAVVAAGKYTGNRRSDDHPIEIAFVHIWTVQRNKIVRVLASVEPGAFEAALG